MRNLRIAVVATVVLCAIGGAQAVTVDCEDLTLGASYIAGDSFTTGGVVISVQELVLSGGTTSGAVTVGNAGNADGSGNELMLDNVTLDIDFGTTINGLALMFGDMGGEMSLSINNAQTNFMDFADVDNMILNGAMVMVAGSGSQAGLFIIGPISQFSIGGQELAIDNLVANCVPEPATMGLLGLGGLLLARRRKG